MRSRLVPVLIFLLLASACAPAPEPAPEPEPEAAPMDDAAAVDAVREAYMTHYNLGHADMVADLFTDDGVYLPADSGVHMGREAILAALTEQLEGGPQVAIVTGDTMVRGDYAVVRGSYSVAVAAEGAEPMSSGGYFMTGFRRVDGDWKIGALLSNYDATPAEGTPSMAPPAEVPEELMDSPTAEIATYYATHYNMGHPGMVASVYAEDAVYAPADATLVEGRAAVEAALTESMAMGSPQLTIHQVGSWDLSDGWFLGGGWYEVTATTDDGETVRAGNWMNVVRPDEDGSQKIHWAIANATHDGM